jgi:3-phenylpropionate/cinnamic acid dioxygenase small subunit
MKEHKSRRDSQIHPPYVSSCDLGESTLLFLQSPCAVVYYFNFCRRRRRRLKIEHDAALRLLRNEQRLRLIRVLERARAIDVRSDVVSFEKRERLEQLLLRDAIAADDLQFVDSVRNETACYVLIPQRFFYIYIYINLHHQTDAERCFCIRNVADQHQSTAWPQRPQTRVQIRFADGLENDIDRRRPEIGIACHVERRTDNDVRSAQLLEIVDLRLIRRRRHDRAAKLGCHLNCRSRNAAAARHQQPLIGLQSTTFE